MLFIVYHIYTNPVPECDISVTAFHEIKSLS